MKKVSVKGKLSLNKETIAKLSNDAMKNMNGAALAITPNTCTACTGGTGSKAFCCYAPCW